MGEVRYTARKSEQDFAKLQISSFYTVELVFTEGVK